MKSDDIVGDPLFQANLVIWMSQAAPRARGYPVIPVFHNAGLRIRAIDQRLPLPQRVLLRAQESGLGMRKEPTPDFLLQDEQDELLLLECKRSSCSAQSDSADQLRAMLVLSGQLLSEAIGTASDAQARVAVLTRQGQTAGFQNTLGELSDRLVSEDLDPSPYGVIGLEVREDGVYIGCGGVPTDLPPGLASELSESKLVLRSHGPDDLQILYPIPWCQDLDEPTSVTTYGQRVIRERTISAFTAMLGRGIEGGNEATIQVEELMRRIIPVWDVWENSACKAALRRRTRRIVHQLLESIQYKTGARFQLDVRAHQFIVSVDDAAHAASVQRALPRLRNHKLRDDAALQGELEGPALDPVNFAVITVLGLTAATVESMLVKHISSPNLWHR